MADRSKFEKMLELLVNENKEAAEELFHEIVVEKSREIYESLLEADDEDEDEKVKESDDEDDDDKVDESDDDLDESDDDLEEGFDLDEFEVSPDFAGDNGVGGDAGDDFGNDIGMDDEDDGMDGMDDMEDGSDDADMKSEITDIKDALAELISKFDELMADEESEIDGGEDDGMDDGEMDFGADDEEDDSEEDDSEEMPSKEAFTYEAKKPMKDEKKDEKKDAKKPVKKTVGEEMREYVEKIGGGHYHQYGKMGDNGTNTKSIVAGKNDMGGTTANILRTDTEQGTEANKGQIKGSSLIKQSPQNMNTKNVNVPGSKTATKLSSVAKGHGAEKKGAGETADKSAGSMLNGAPKRAK